jgi:hypothetical protein
MDRYLREMLVRSQADAASHALRAFGGAASAIGKAVENFMDGLAQGISSVAMVWAETNARAEQAEENTRRAPILEASMALRALFVNLLGEDAWKAYEKMRAERGRSTFNSREWTEFFEGVFGKAKAAADAAAATKTDGTSKGPEAPAAPAAS